MYNIIRNKELYNALLNTFWRFKTMKILSNTIFNKLFFSAVAARGLVSPGTNKDYSETEFKSAFIVNADSTGFAFSPDDDRPERLLQAFFAATAAYLGKYKVTKTDEAVALVLTDMVGMFKFAAIVQYHENEENPDEPGNWSFTMTFNEDDIDSLEKKKSVKKILYNDNSFTATFVKVAYDISAIEIMHTSYCLDSYLLIIDTLLQILDREAKANEVVDIEVPGYITASVSVEGDEKIFAITPDGYLKTIIKNDSVLEK